ncbi:hypothetical protein CQ12_38030 [Bradyrhizobium jicamae]|uniref:Uncharacterized protein n=1 Tax=Bradyrhizobium jicamae TaxID=280332 RepID=A0A0R3KYU1_9BRAD|nr:AAA family ATPase [Bradyrhizobium jicamae]KRQ98718.1 hypothetical protein CQ12_38030 [Bradyrhizobium jicamae]
MMGSAIHGGGEHSTTRDGFISAHELLRKVFSPIEWIVPDLIPEGLTIVASKSKMGKSWLMLDLAWQVAASHSFLGRQCARGDVLVLALEDSERRLKDRMQKLDLMFSPAHKEAQHRIHFKTTWRRSDLGGVADMAKWLDEHPATRLIIVDVWRKIAPPHKAGTIGYNQDYEHLNEIHRLANDRRIAIVLVMHLKKAPSETGDPFDDVMGSAGQVGVADTTLILRRTPTGVTLYARGRDVQEIELAVKFDADTCRWESLGDAEKLKQAQETNSIVNALRACGAEMTTLEIVERTGMERRIVDVELGRLAKQGKIRRTRRGVYEAVSVQ